jgi:hypothetical protein
MTVVFVEAKKLPHEQRMSQSVVTIQGPGVVAPLAWTFAPNVLPQLPQNIAIKFSIHHLSWWNKFIMHNAFSVKLLPYFRSWFWSKVVRKALHHQLTSFRS